MVSASNIFSEITFNQSTDTSAPALSIFELTSSIPWTVSNLHCFNAFNSCAFEIGLDSISTTSASSVVYARCMLHHLLLHLFLTDFS